MKLLRTLAALLLGFVAIPLASAQGEYRTRVAAFTYDGSSWVAAATSASAGALSYVPEQVLLYCYNTGTSSWVPADSSCFGGGGGSMTWPSTAGIAVYAGSNTWGTSLTAPSGAIVGTTDAQTLTNKTLTTPTISVITNVGTITLPTTTTTLAGLAVAQTFSAIQTFAAAGVRLLGSSTGYTTFASGNASGSNFTVNFPAATDTIAYVALAQSLTNKTVNGVTPATFAFLDPSSSVQTQLNTKFASAAFTQAAILALWTGTCSGSTYLRGDGACAAPSGSGTVNSGSGYKLAVYASGASTAVGPATGLATDSTGNSLVVPGSVTTGGSTSDVSVGSATAIFAGTEAATAGTPTAGHDYIRLDSTTHGAVSSYNGGSEFRVPQVIASGQTAMPTGSVSANSCSASATTATATGAATTDGIEVTYASDPTGVTGYGGGTAGGITIRPWPTSNTISFKLCNETGSSITPGALNVNWRIVR